ncbi:glycosyltransferase [Marinobacter sp. F3R08]|nr:glycosyltransferase [Marinobacter sp. F3R08]
MEEAIRQICIASGKHGVRHRVLTLAKTPSVDTLERPEATVIRAPLHFDPASCSMGMGLFRLYREQARWADVIHVHYPWPFADLVHMLTGVRKPVVLTYHSDIIRQRRLEALYRPLRSCFFSRVQAVVATSPNYLASSPLLSRLGDKCSVIPLGLSPESYAPPSAEASAAVERSYGSGFYLFVGVLRYYKGLDTLVRAAARNGLKVVIAGRGPEEARLRQLASRLDARNVHFAGFVTDDFKQALLERCRAVVFPSYVRSEAFGVTLLEGQLHAKPLITCEIGTGTTFVNLADETGLVVPPNDAEALAGAMLEIEREPARAERLGQAGRERLESVFSGDLVGRSYYELYKNVAQR